MSLKKGFWQSAAVLAAGVLQHRCIAPAAQATPLFWGAHC